MACVSSVWSGEGQAGILSGQVVGLLILDSEPPRDQNQKPPILSMARPRAATGSLLLCSVGQSKSQGRPRFKGRGIRPLLIEGGVCVCGYGGIIGCHLWRPSTTHTLQCNPTRAEIFLFCSRMYPQSGHKQFLAHRRCSTDIC